jgi:dimethylaniline monooxygenase (N-oxide forming)
MLNADHARREEDYDAVVVCTGRHQVPHLPAFLQEADFEGRVLHSIQYAGPEAFRDQRVLLIGSGATAADLAVQMSQTARHVFVSVRPGRWFIPRHLDGKPVDFQLTRALNWAPPFLRHALFKGAIWRELRRIGLEDGGKSIGLPVPEFDLGKVRLTLNTQFLLGAWDGAVTIVPEVHALRNHEAQFRDGSSQKVDAVIAATGYGLRFPFMPSGNDVVTEDNDLNLYRYVFPPSLPRVAFVGALIVQGPFVPVYEMQARWVGRVFAGRKHLPSQRAMAEQIAKRRAQTARSGDRRTLVPYVAYLEALARELGVRPRLWRHPTLLRNLLFDPVNGTHYRLDGPHAWTLAPRAVRDACLVAPRPD